MLDNEAKNPETNQEVSTRTIPQTTKVEIPTEILEQITAKARQEQEARYKTKLTNTQRNYEQELISLKNEILFEKEVKPTIQTEFLKNGGKMEYFNDFFNLNSSKFSNPEKIKETLLETRKTTGWAFKEQSSVNDQVSKGLGTNGVVDLSVLHKGTIYKKKTTTR